MYQNYANGQKFQCLNLQTAVTKMHLFLLDILGLLVNCYACRYFKSLHVLELKYFNINQIQEKIEMQFSNRFFVLEEKSFPPKMTQCSKKRRGHFPSAVGHK